LLVEDHADTRHVLAKLLRGVGHAIITADTAAAALRTLEGIEGEAIDLLVSDLALPDGTGLDVVRALRADRSHNSVKAIALSGWGMTDDVRKSTEAGFDRHLTKPVSFDALLEAIDQLCGAPTTG